MISGVVGGEQRLTQNCLSFAVRDTGEQIDLFTCYQISQPLK